MLARTILSVFSIMKRKTMAKVYMSWIPNNLHVMDKENMEESQT